MPERSARMRDGTPEGAARVGTAARTQRVIVGSSRICGLPSPRTARNASPDIFVFWYPHVYIVEAKEVTVGRYHLAGELDGGLLAVAYAEEDT